MENIQIKPFKVIGISVRTTNENGQAMKDISALWQRFFSEGILAAIPNKVNDTIYGTYTDYESDHTRPYTTIIGCKVTDIEHVPEGMTARSFEGGSYAKLSAKGNLHRIVGAQWVEIWQSDLNRAYTADFEVYDERASDPTNAEVDFLIAVK